jgi:hypothetical protein
MKAYAKELKRMTPIQRYAVKMRTDLILYGEHEIDYNEIEKIVLEAAMEANNAQDNSKKAKARANRSKENSNRKPKGSSNKKRAKKS